MIRLNSEDTYLGYTWDDALRIGTEMFGETWCTQDVVSELEWAWSIALNQAEIGQGSSSSDTRKEYLLYILREWCMKVDKKQGYDISWYLDSLKLQVEMQDAINETWDAIAA